MCKNSEGSEFVVLFRHVSSACTTYIRVDGGGGGGEGFGGVDILGKRCTWTAKCTLCINILKTCQTKFAAWWQKKCPHFRILEIYPSVLKRTAETLSLIKLYFKKNEGNTLCRVILGTSRVTILYSTFKVCYVPRSTSWIDVRPPTNIIWANINWTLGQTLVFADFRHQSYHIRHPYLSVSIPGGSWSRNNNKHMGYRLS